MVAGQVRKVTFQGDKATGELTSGQTFTSTVPNNDSTLWQTLREHGVDTSVVPADENVPWFLNLLVNWFPMLAILLGVWIFFPRQMQVGRRQGDGLRQVARQVC